MREEGLQGKVPKRFKQTTDSRHDDPIAANLLDRDFTAASPNQRWVGDTTEFVIGDGGAKLYLAAILDLFSRPQAETRDGRPQPTPENQGRLFLIDAECGRLKPSSAVWLANSCKPSGRLGRSLRPMMKDQELVWFEREFGVGLSIVVGEFDFESTVQYLDNGPDLAAQQALRRQVRQQRDNV